MGETFVGTVWSFHSDKEGECKITFLIPMSHKQHATMVSNWTEQVLHINVFQEHEIKAQIEQAEDLEKP